MKKCLSIFVAAYSSITFASGSPNEAVPQTVFEAIRRGDVTTLRSMLNKAGPINARDSEGNTPLIYAAAYSNVRTVRVLLENGADPNATNKSGVTALMRSASDLETVRLLLRHGADPNIKSALGNTALMLAAGSYPSARRVDILLQKGADIHVANAFGASAILTAAASGDAETIRLLIQHGTDVNAVPARSLDGMIWGGGRSALGWAATLGYEDCAQLLLNNRASINCGEGFGSPLSQAVWHNEKSMVKFLLERGANPNQRDRMADFAPLHWAASTDYSKSDIADLLLKHGANVNVEGGEPVDALMGVPQTPLLLAQKRGQTELADALRKAGAKPETSPSVELSAAARVSRPGDSSTIRDALRKAIPRLQETANTSAGIFVQRGQACNSCHQQYSP